MVEWLLLDRVHAESTRAPVSCENNRVIEPAPDKTESTLAFSKTTKPGTEVALNSAIVQTVPVACWDNASVSGDLDVHQYIRLLV